MLLSSSAFWTPTSRLPSVRTCCREVGSLWIATMWVQPSDAKPELISYMHAQVSVQRAYPARMRMVCHNCASGLPLSWEPSNRTSRQSAVWPMTTRVDVPEVSQVERGCRSCDLSQQNHLQSFPLPKDVKQGCPLRARASEACAVRQVNCAPLRTAVHSCAWRRAWPWASFLQTSNAICAQRGSAARLAHMRTAATRLTACKSLGAGTPFCGSHR